FQVGGKNIIVLNDFESIKEVLTRKEVLYRTENFILRRFGVNGIVTLNGDAWQENRRFCLHVLRDLGFGRKSMEEHVKEEARYLTEKILDLRGAPLEVRKYLVPSMSNNITALVFGSRYPFEDYRRKFLDETLAKALKIVASGPLFTFLPRWTFSVAELLPFTSISTIRSTLGDIFRFITAAADTEYKGNFIPKGSVILANIAAVHTNPDIWNDPDEFNPRRFLKEDGSSLITKPEQLIPFSIAFLSILQLLSESSALMEILRRFASTILEDPGEATRLAFTIVVPWLLLVASIAWLRKSKAPRGTTLPPGPPGYPLVGLLPLGAKLLHPKFLKEWAEKYGPVLRLKVAFTNLIVLNDFESIKEVMCMKELLHRTGNLVIDQTGCKGLLSLNGQIWNDNRRICLHVLRDLGFGKKAMEDWMKEEAEYLVKKIAERRGAPFVVLELLVPSASNNISAIIFGARYPFEDSRRKFLDDRLKRLSKFIGNRSLSPLLPVLVTRLASKIPILRERLPGPILDDLLAFIKREIKEHEETLDENSDRDFIDAYLKKIKENKDNPSSTFSRLAKTSSTKTSSYPKYWKDPEEFNPSRFLNEDGSALLPKPDQLIPFGVGKRMCPGETMATVEIFLYLTTILQAFNVLPEEGQSIDLSSETTALRLAQNPKLRFISRQIDQGP
ncbi:hypothetical protein V5799_011971, partial [Amblyomma americanum]